MNFGTVSVPLPEAKIYATEYLARRAKSVEIHRENEIKEVMDYADRMRANRFLWCVAWFFTKAVHVRTRDQAIAYLKRTDSGMWSSMWDYPTQIGRQWANRAEEVLCIPDSVDTIQMDVTVLRILRNKCE